MNCVNRSHKDFKVLAEHNDISPDLLELITHKYWAETGSEDNLPSDMYIQGQLGKGQYEEYNNSVKKLWENNYSKPQEFKSKAEFNTAYTEALKFFPTSAVAFHKNFKNDFVLTVKKPVSKVKITVQDILGRESNNAQELSDFKLINSKLDEANYEQFAVESSQTELQQWEKEVLPKILTHIENMLIPVKYKKDMEQFFKEHPNTLIQQALDNKKAPNSLDIVDESIRTGNWSDEAIDELDNLNNEDYGKILKRFSQEELGGSDEILKQAETIVSRGSRSSDTSNSQGNRERAEQQIESWAKENGLWYNNYQESKDGSLESVIEADGGVFSNKSGSESLVYWMNDGTTVKAIGASHYEGDIQRLLDKVILHNSLFPETAYSTLGFGRDRGGAFRIIIKQQIVQGTRPTTEEILSFIDKLGLEKKKGWYYTEDGKRLTDLNYNNIIKVGENTFAVIDCDVEFTPEYLNSIKDLPQLFTTPEGEVYGFVDKDGNMYLDETIIHPEHPIHEYTHLWDRVIIKKNPKLWKRGIFLMKKTSLWEKYANHEQYGKKWKALKDMTDEKLDNLIASEVHARLVGKEGSKLLAEEAKKKGAKGIIQRLRTWLLDVFKELKSTFSNWSDEELDKLTLDDYVNMTVRDFFTGVNLKEKNGPIQFTFRDGTTIPMSFVPNYQQVAALNAMNDFLNSDETTMTLSGYAGTGKTTLMEIIAQKAKKQHKPIMFSATTNKAAAVLKSRVSKAGFDAQTLNKVFGINVEVDSSKAYNARNLVTALKEAQVFPGTTVVIDEASMINEENYSILNEIARENDLKIIYVGDKAQLAPVNENQVSKVFRNSEGRVVELTKVERTDDNAILKEATNIRNGLPLSGESSFNERGEGVGYLTPKSRDEIGKVIRHYIQGLKDNPNFFRILAWQNKTVTAYNDYVRTLFGYTDYIPHVEEPLTGYANWGWNDRTREYRFINSEAYKVTKVSSPQKTSISIDGKTYEMEYVPVTAENSMGEIDTYNYMDIRGNQENLRVAKILAQKKTELWDKWRHTVGREAKTNIRLQINAIDQFLFVNDKIEDTSRTLPDGSHPLLQQKVVDFGYALTVHKSQGSTFTHVMMDEMDIAKSEKNNAANSQELYKGEDRWVAPEDQQTSISDEINLGIDEYETKPQTTPNASATATNPNAANVRQQLEYVAVSRATNTVTILSNNVKKEGSPLGTQQTQVPQAQPQIEKVELPKGFKESTSREGAIHLEIGGKYGYPEYVNAMQRHLLVGDVYVSYNSQTGKYIIERGDRNGNYKTKELDSLTDEWIAAEAFKPQIARALEKYFKTSVVANNEIDSSQSQNQQQSTPSSYEGLVTPEANTIFVFGSNPEGIHGAGAAKTAKDKFGAIYGQGEGLQGQSYALPTKRIEKSLPTSRPAKVRLDVLLAEKLLNGQEIQEIVVAPYHTKDKQEDFKDLKKGEILNVEETNGYSNNRTKRNLQVRVKEVSNDNGIVKATFELASANGERTITESQIIENIKKLYEVARQNPNKQFKIGYTNELHEYTRNGYQGSEMIRMFKDAGSIPSNIVFSKNWTDNWNKVASKNPSPNKASNSYKVKGSSSIEVKGENITSKGSEFAKKLTNPGNNLEVIYKGKTFRNAEHAYQTWKSGEFDEVAYKSEAFKPRGSKPVNKQTNYQTMVEILTAKLQQHPELVQGITERGGEVYLKASTHDMIGDKYWETKTGQNKFIEALTDAYNAVVNQANKSSLKRERSYGEAPIKLPKGVDVSQVVEKLREPLKSLLKEYSDIKYEEEIGHKATSFGASGWVKHDVISTKSILESLNNAGYSNYNLPTLWDLIHYSTSDGSTLDGSISRLYKEHPELEEKVAQLIVDNIEGVQVTNQRESTINPEESRFNKEADLIAATVAPYFKTSYEDYVAMTPEKQKEMREAFAKAAHEVAKALGIPLDMKQASFNIGGYEFEDGSSVIEPSFTFRFGKDATPEQVRMFAALMGDLGYEQQEAVVTSWDVANEEERDGDRHFIEFKEEELPLLKQFGIKNFTFDKTRGVLSVLSFDTKDVENFYKLVETIKQKENGLEETQRRNPRRASFKTFYDEKEGRRALYEAWSANAKDRSAEEGRPSGSNNLVQEALEKLQNRELPIDRETPTEQPQKIPLANYEYMMDFTEDTTVDAAWKVPLLEQLDKQLGLVIEQDSQLENPDYTEQNEILDRMTRILESKSEDELLDLQSEEPKTKKTVEQNLTEFEKMTQQINNLLDSNIISASEIRHVAELVVNSISDTISILQKEEGAAKEFFPNVETDIDFKTASRQKIVEAVGINNLIHRAKQQFDPEQNDYEDFDTIDQADLIIDNWDAIMTLASDTFAMTEGFGIMRNYDKGGFATTQAPTVDFDNFNDYTNDPDAMAEEEKDEQEHWQVEQRTIDVLNSMSQLVRLALHECYQMDKEGNKVMSKWGIAERVNPRQAVNSILRWTQGSLTLEDMINKMTAKSTQNPWLNQLVERLSDKSGKEADFQSQFFGVFSKHFQPYSVVLLEDGKYHSIPVNNHPALSEAMQTITTQFKIGEHPLFSNNGINRKLLGSEQTVYPEADFNLHKALTSLRTIQDRINHGEQLNNSMSKEVAANIMGVCKIMGYNVTEDMLSDAINEENLKKMTNSLGFIVKSLDAAKEEQIRNEGTPNAKAYNPFAFGTDNGIAGTLRNFLTPITDTLEDTAVSAFYDSGKMYQSYVTPSFMTKLMNKFRLEGKEFENFIMEEYGTTEWFKSSKNQWDISKGWRNEWLKKLATDENARKVFDHKVELNFNKHNYMRNMSDAEYTLSLITEYFAETGQKKEALVPAWFRVPIMSNKPSSEFIKFYSYRGANYKDEIIYGLHQMFNQELSRIQTVNMRNHSKGDAEFIANFDTNGRKFNFLPFLNKYLNSSKGLVTGSLYATDGSFNGGIAGVSSQTILKQSENRLRYLLNKKINGLEALTAEEEAQLSSLVDQVIRQDMENRVATILNQWENSGILEAAKNIEGVGTEEAQIRANIENFLWNDNFASKNILQLTITDIAFYKDAEDLQKRLAQIHAPGIRGNIAATDYEGNRVTDGKYRTILIQGLQKFKTDLIANIAEVFDRKIAAAPESQKAQLKALKENLVGENGRYTKIDVTDGQAYSSPSSYRKKAFIFGKWSRHAEEIYQKLKKGDYNYTDLEVAFQPLKPFVYSHLQKDMGVDSAPIHQMPVPFQAKNSEYLLIMADALLQGEQTSKPNLLRAIYRVMEDSERLNPTKGIDTVQFDSAIKSGLQAPIDLNPFVDMVGGEEAAFEYMNSVIYKLDDQGNPSNEYNTNTYVHEGLYEDYCLQQEVPEHFKNHSQAHGSQIRMITPSDLDFYKNPNADHNDPNNQVFYEWTEPDGTKKRVRADEFRHEYEETIAANIRESIDNLSQELHINSDDKKERNIALSKILQREILSSPRYGIDLIQACSVDKETGEFRIPKGDPIQAKRIEQLINSIIKNRVNKQKIAGGPIVQVTNFGASRQLHIRFNDKNGGLLMTREEYEQNPQKKEMSQTDKFNARYGKKTATGNMTYEEYVKQNQAGIAYFEVFIPMWTNEIFEKFSDKEGSINMEALEATAPELLKMISYRIPTEDKYSCAPMKAVGFMPREAGDAIMFPYELTEIDDSDFDVDKRYVMRKVSSQNAKGQIFHKKPSHTIRKELFDIVEKSYKKQHNNRELPSDIAGQVEAFLDSPGTMRNKDGFTNWLYSQYQKVAYTTKAPTSGKEYRDNKIVDMTWAVLTNEMTADKILNPGGFDVFKRNGYMVAAYKNPTNNYTWEQLQQMSIDELNKLSYTDKDLTWLDTQIQFYKQNAAAASLIGVFAVNKVAHATLESNDYWLGVNDPSVCGEKPFKIAGTTFGGLRNSEGRALMLEDEFNEAKKTDSTLKDLSYEAYILANKDDRFTGRMKVDPSHDAEGNLIGKTIGAGVSASADAAKTPVLNLMNINMTTAGMFNTLLRLGMAPNDASLFMSQDIIERLLNEFNRENLTNYKPLSTIIEEHLSDLREKHNISDNSNINFEPLSREELVEGLLPEDHEVIDYKVLLAFQRVRTLVDYMRKPTYATRFNSVSSAVGPLIIDNLIMEHKMEQFMDAGTEDGTHFYDSKGNTIDIDDIFYDHPILKEFSRTVDIAKMMFNDMPAGSRGFRNLLATLPEGMVDKVFNDKKLLDDLSNFYQSYLLIASRMINPANLKNYIDGFPEYFNKEGFKEKYPDNALIQAIRMNVAKRTGRPFLSINITGIDEAQKEVYRSAWIDLHKDNPELSKRLFEYCFFRAGIGFSPKTFMSLVPAYVKERLSTDLGNGTQATYVDTYRMFPNVNPNVVIDQWIRNNWDNNKLVPKKGGEGTHYIVDLQRGTLIARDPKDMADLKNDAYIKTRHNGQTYLWKQLIADETSVHYNMVKPLGNNGEYMEMSLADIIKPLNETKETVEDMKESELQTTSPAEADAAETSNPNNTTDSEKVKQVDELADLLMKQNPKFNKTQALNQIEKMKEKPDLYAGFLVNVFKQKGLNLSKEEAIKEFKKMC